MSILFVGHFSATVKPKILGTIIENLPSTEVTYQICKCSRVNFHFCSSSDASNGPSPTQTLTLTAVNPEKFAKAKQSTCNIHVFEDFKICCNTLLRCFDIVFQRPYRYFSIGLKVILSLTDRYKIFTID